MESKMHKPPKVDSVPQVPLVLGKSPEGLPAIVISNPSEKTRTTVRQVVMANHRNDPDYKIKKTVGPFLQCDDKDYVLVEFWTGQPEDHAAYVEYMNKRIAEESI